MDIGLIGFGISNQALYKHFKGLHRITVHNEKEISLPCGVQGAFGSNYLDCSEDLVFRSPSVRPDRIRSCSPVMCEAEYALDKLGGIKICVTGSDGKTTTSSLIFSALQSEGAYLGGNIGNPLINAIGRDYRFIVSELSSFQLMDFSPACDVCVITNITENHLNYHKDMNEYISSKENLLKNAKRIVLNYDDEILRKIGKKYENVRYFSLKERCDAYVEGGYVCLRGKRLFNVDRLKLVGNFNLLNVLAALLAVCDFVNLDKAVDCFCNFCGVENRMELVLEKNGIKFYNSSADTTPSRSVATTSYFDKSRLVVILGGSDKELSYDILKDCLANVKGVVLLGENKDKILMAIDGIDAKIFTANTVEEAVSIGYGLCNRGDTVLLSPASASFDAFRDYKERGQRFKKAVVSLFKHD